MKFAEMDRCVTLREQFQHDVAPIVLINTFSVSPDEADRLVEVWAADAAYFQAQPGFISTQLHRGIGGSCTFLNYAVWESVDHFRRAFSSPQFQSLLARYPASTTASPHVFQKLTVPGICEGS